MLSDAYAKGLTGFNLNEAYTVAKKVMAEKTYAPWRRMPKGALDQFFDEKGYYPALPPSYISAPEYQILDNANHPDAKLGKDGNRQSASLYDMIPANPQNSKVFGEWNKAKIMCYKGTVVHYQNDEAVVEYHLWTPQWTEMLQKSKFSQEKWPLAFELLNNCGGENREGFFGLQDHGDTQ